ncbi:MAG: hypothetical protein COB49_06875 [Alphaproteobacteria bacterium]|nr:MAG: hypothetical protein COB49_06875 [Alphaproteobacteria bacterium]
MKKMHKKINDIHDQAAYWFTRFESGLITAGQRLDFEAWVNENPQHLRAFEEIETLSGAMQALSEDLKRRSPDKETSLRGDVLKNAALLDAHRARKKRFILFRRAASIAASILVVFAGVWLWQSSSLNGADLYRTAVGEQKTVMLSDGSVMTLNTNSEISVAMTDNVRRLHLKKGEVYFEVAKDKNRPFEVAVQNAFVKAVGTAFNIKQQNDQISVLVTEGTVEVKSNFVPRLASFSANSSEKKETLIVGDQIIFGQKKMERVNLESHLVSRKTLWRKGRIFLDQKSLAEIVREIQPYIADKIIIADEEVAALIAGGVFKMGEINSFFGALEAALPVTIVREKGVIILMRRHGKLKDPVEI